MEGQVNILSVPFRSFFFLQCRVSAILGVSLLPSITCSFAEELYGAPTRNMWCRNRPER
jgi:hypothetical protein